MDETETENFDSTNEEAEETTETIESTEKVETEDESEKLREQNKRLFERAKKAEAEAKALKAQTTPQTTITTPSVDPEELKLIARGLSDNEIEKAKIIAKGNGITLKEALSDDMFIAYQTKLKDDARKEKAKLGASRGSGQETDNKGIKPDMSREEHMAKFKELTQA